jgi:hypothetical protein
VWMRSEENMSVYYSISSDSKKWIGECFIYPPSSRRQIRLYIGRGKVSMALKLRPASISYDSARFRTTTPL